MPQYSHRIILVSSIQSRKIGASFQPGQAERYHKRGEDGKNEPEKKWNRFWTCLVASKNYVKRGHGFDAAVELEQIRDWLAVSEPKRQKFKIRVINQAIENANKRGIKPQNIN